MAHNFISDVKIFVDGAVVLQNPPPCVHQHQPAVHVVEDVFRLFFFVGQILQGVGDVLGELVDRPDNGGEFIVIGVIDVEVVVPPLDHLQMVGDPLDGVSHGAGDLPGEKDGQGQAGQKGGRQGKQDVKGGSHSLKNRHSCGIDAEGAQQEGKQAPKDGSFHEGASNQLGYV